jgi:hypothetical protein
MASSAWAYGNGTSTVSATCDAGSFVYSGNLGVATDTGDNAAGFGFTLLGYVVETDTSVDCTVSDLSGYTGLSISLSSASGAVTAVIIGVDLADGSQGSLEITVGTAAAATTVTWTQLGITDASQITGIWGSLVNGDADVTVDLVIDSLTLTS